MEQYGDDGIDIYCEWEHLMNGHDNQFVFSYEGTLENCLGNLINTPCVNAESFSLMYFDLGTVSDQPILNILFRFPGRFNRIRHQHSFGCLWMQEQRLWVFFPNNQESGSFSVQAVSCLLQGYWCESCRGQLHLHLDPDVRSVQEFLQCSIQLQKDEVDVVGGDRCGWEDILVAPRIYSMTNLFSALWPTIPTVSRISTWRTVVREWRGRRDILIMKFSDCVLFNHSCLCHFELSHKLKFISVTRVISKRSNWEWMRVRAKENCPIVQSDQVLLDHWYPSNAFQ